MLSSFTSFDVLQKLAHCESSRRSCETTSPRASAGSAAPNSQASRPLRNSRRAG